ncbi:hypothetical protein OIU79_015645 [Salix purpurea]|uniref:Uncharacterized protein n=1 Tax=Salix purpurea TaxID=77065 RepID=A0A9Q0SQ68_SALPP|nr:hypothetical protein OIU79_015645 [Salix purpurea]
MTEGGQKVKKNGNNGGIPFMVLPKWVHLRLQWLVSQPEMRGQLSKSSLKKTMEDRQKSLEQTDEANGSVISNSSSEFKINDRDPLFVANVGDYYSESVG